MTCEVCKKEYTLKHKYSKEYLKKRKYCSRECYKNSGDRTWYKKGNRGMVGKENPSWKGDECSYNSLHLWVHRWKTKSKLCEKCGEEKKLQAANKSGKYLRKKSDWLWLCSICHSDFDKGRCSIKDFLSTGRKLGK